MAITAVKLTYFTLRNLVDKIQQNLKVKCSIQSITNSPTCDPVNGYYIPFDFIISKTFDE